MSSMNILEFEKLVAELDDTIAKARQAAARESRDALADFTELEAERDQLLREFFEGLTPWDEVLLARHASRPYTLDYVPLITEDFLELHGDRLFGDDGAMVGGFAQMGGQSVLLVGQQKGRDLKERQKRNFGYVRPEGYRKALRLMQTAAKFRRPIVTFVDTPGADPNVSSEERGISESIARNLREMSLLASPIVSVIIGEGGSGGALGIAVADRVIMLEHSIYSVIAPEGCASIIWRDPTRGADAARAMRVTAKDALALGLIDEVIPEPLGGAHRDPEATAAAIKEAVIRSIRDLSRLTVSRLRAQRYQKLRALGRFAEEGLPDNAPPAAAAVPASV
ncbi:MAG: acetyl-CoA carboxylase carboxyltransferase subunit alpha [Cytophagales bacterium]|nr:acetyl-CoA carboxylase carboxyltransferase subunit alpha [Armatimonadota bacterium]